VLALGATNAVGVVLFGTLYAVAGARLLPRGAFLACLVLLFVLMTVLWVRVEARQARGVEAVRRIGRVAIGLVVVVISVPAVLLMPLFWLDTHVPEEAGLRPLLAPVMSLVLIALILTAAVNVLGAAIATVRYVAGRRR
jgi:hypothetical protein